MDPSRDIPIDSSVYQQHQFRPQEEALVRSNNHAMEVPLSLRASCLIRGHLSRITDSEGAVTPAQAQLLIHFLQIASTDQSPQRH